MASSNVERQEPESPDPRSSEQLTNLAIRTYLRFKGKSRRDVRLRKGRSLDTESSQPFSSGRDPHHISSIVSNTAKDLGWSLNLSQAEVFEHWNDLVGSDIAAQTQPTVIRDETLFIECSSTAWATQLRLMRGTLLAQIHEQYPDSGIKQLRFIQPKAPSWKKGPRTVSGRGPRDTYG